MSYYCKYSLKSIYESNSTELITVYDSNSEDIDEGFYAGESDIPYKVDSMIMHGIDVNPLPFKCNAVTFGEAAKIVADYWKKIYVEDGDWFYNRETEFEDMFLIGFIYNGGKLIALITHHDLLQYAGAIFESFPSIGRDLGYE